MPQDLPKFRQPSDWPSFFETLGAFIAVLVIGALCFYGLLWTLVYIVVSAARAAWGTP